jgi:hypothetical protein
VSRAAERYVGESRFLHLWPPGMLAFGVVVLVGGGSGALFYGAIVAGIGIAVGLVLPWRFVVFPDGLGLYFAFGRRLFLPRPRVTIRADRGGAVVMVPERRLGYPLTDGLVERRRLELRAVLLEHGFTVV